MSILLSLTQKIVLMGKFAFLFFITTSIFVLIDYKKMKSRLSYIRRYEIKVDEDILL